MTNKKHPLLRVAICDDDDTICLYLEDILDRNDYHFSVAIYNNGTQFLQHLEQGEYFDLIFLDIKMDDITGIEIGRMLRNYFHNEQTKIIYISTEESYAMDLFDVRPFHFLIKPLNEKKVIDIVETVIALLPKEQAYFKYYKKSVLRKVPVHNILYFEKNKKEVQMNLESGEKIRFYATLKEIYKELERYDFFYCHKSILVNYHQINKFNYGTLIMSNQKALPIAQPKRAAVRKLQLELGAS